MIPRKTRSQQKSPARDGLAAGSHMAAESRFAPRLLAWYARHGRDLPWRRTRDPYRILVSEVMLQQTQVSRVLAYYGRFLEAFPDVKSLAAASLDHVLKLWEGMGYYARARNLHRAAGTIVRRHDATVPADVETLQTLPGVGYNTAAAVASLAYHRPWPVLDGNATRVLCRVLCLSFDPRTAAGRKRLMDLAGRLVPAGQMAPFNQAIMDLGAEVCRPADPRCQHCPLEKVCAGREAGHPARYPQRRPRRQRPHYDVTAGIIWRGGCLHDDSLNGGRPEKRSWKRGHRSNGRLLVARRPPEKLLGGLWEFPGGKREDGESLEECLRREIKEELGISVRVDAPFMSIEHGYSHFRFTLHAFHCTYLEGRPRPLGCSDFRWVRISDLEKFALSRADQKLAAALREEKPPTSTT
jgi:A/G-specific adenine glycosylase